MYYRCGYYQKSFSPIVFQTLLLGFLGFCLILVAFAAWIVSLIQRQQRVWTTTVLAGLLALWGLKYVLHWHDDLILYGMRDGMLRNYGLDEMRHFARDFDKLPKIPKNDVDGRTKLYWNILKNDDLPKTGLKEKYTFLAQCEAVVERDNIVYVDWGGFENHWGVCISVNDKRIDPQPQYWARIVRASDDIYFTFDY